MGEELHYDWFASPTNNRDSGLLPQATRPISGRGLPVVEVHWKRSTALKLLVYSTIVLLVALCGRRLLQHPSKHGRRIADVDWGGDSSSLSDDDENNPCGDLRIDDRQTSPGVHDESPPQSDAASTQAPGTGAAEEGVSISCEDESSGDAAAAAPEAAADDEDDDSNSNCSTPIYDIVCSGQGRTSNDGDSKVAESHDAPAAPGRESVKSKMGRLRRARWMRPVAGFLESAGKKISSLAAPEAAADDEDDDSNSNCSTPVYDIVCSRRGRSNNGGESTIAEPHDAPGAHGRESVKRKVDRLRRARWVRPLTGLLESAGRKISSLAPKSAVAASPAAGGVAGETAASSSEASQPEDTWRFNAKLAVGDSRSPHYKDLQKPYDFPHLKAENYTELRRELLKLAESIGDLCSPHTEPFQATVKADCDISGVGRVTLYLQIVEEDMIIQGALGQLRGRIVSDNPFSRRFPERFTRDLLALAEELSVTVSDHAQQKKMPNGRTEFYSTMLEKPAAAACTGIKADAEDSADRDGEQGMPKTDAPIQPGNSASGSSADELVDAVRTVQATVGDAAAAAASDVATAETGGGIRSEASEEAGSREGAPQPLHGRHVGIFLQGMSWFGRKKSRNAPVPERKTGRLSTVLEKQAGGASIGKASLKTNGIKADAEDSADRDGEQGMPKTDAPIQPGNSASGSSADELVDAVRTVQATVGDAAAAAASDVATAETGGGIRSEASEEAGSREGAPQPLHGRHVGIFMQGTSWFGRKKSRNAPGEAPAKANVGDESPHTGWTSAPIAAASATGADDESQAYDGAEGLSDEEMIHPLFGPETAESGPTRDQRVGDDSNSVHLEQLEDVGSPFAGRTAATYREQQQSGVSKSEAPCSSPGRTSGAKKHSLQEPAGATAATTDYGASSAPTNKRGPTKSGGLHPPMPSKERRLFRFKRKSSRQNVSCTRESEGEKLQKALKELQDVAGSLCFAHQQLTAERREVEYPLKNWEHPIFLQLTIEEIEFKPGNAKLTRKSKADVEKFKKLVTKLFRVLVTRVTTQAQETRMPQGQTNQFSVVLERPQTAQCFGKVVLKAHAEL